MTRLYDRSFALIFLCQVSFVLGNVMMAHYARWIEWLGGLPSGWSDCEDSEMPSSHKLPSGSAGES